MDSLRQLASPSASAVRESEVVVIPANQLVIGDIVQLKTGDVVPADLRLITSTNFETDEALLTGESLPVQKNHSATWNDKSEDESWSPSDVGVGGEALFSSSARQECSLLHYAVDRINMAFSSSTVTKGRCTGIVVAIGMDVRFTMVTR